MQIVCVNCAVTRNQLYCSPWKMTISGKESATLFFQHSVLRSWVCLPTWQETFRSLRRRSSGTSSLSSLHSPHCSAQKRKIMLLTYRKMHLNHTFLSSTFRRVHSSIYSYAQRQVHSESLATSTHS